MDVKQKITLEKGMNQMGNITLAPKNAFQLYPDSARYKSGFAVKSQSSNRLYKISYDAAPGAMYWVCACPGCCVHGQCKHLTACGLKGRKFGANLTDGKKLGIIG